MKQQIVAKQIETAICDKPGMMGLIASSEDNEVEIIFEAMQAPAIVSGILLSSQEAAKKMRPKIMAQELAKNIEALSSNDFPEAIDVALAADGDVLCINVGSGMLLFKLSDAAKKPIKKLSDIKDRFTR